MNINNIVDTLVFCQWIWWKLVTTWWTLTTNNNTWTPTTTNTMNFNNIMNTIRWTPTMYDALPSHGVKPTWGFHKVKLRKVETWRHAPGFQL
jgi:hypothetical protein